MEKREYPLLPVQYDLEKAKYVHSFPQLHLAVRPKVQVPRRRLVLEPR